MAKAKRQEAGNGSAASALAQLEPRVRAAVVEEVTWVLLKRFNFGETCENDLEGLREAARELGTPYVLLRFVIDRQLDEEAREVRPHEAEEYVRWCEKHAPERLEVANG